MSGRVPAWLEPALRLPPSFYSHLLRPRASLFWEDETIVHPCRRRNFFQPLHPYNRGRGRAPAHRPCLHTVPPSLYS